jgi:hypothetical protein
MSPAARRAAVSRHRPPHTILLTAEDEAVTGVRPPRDKALQKCHFLPR